MKFLKYILSLSLFILCNCSEGPKTMQIASTYVEPVDPAPKTNEDWSQIPGSLNASFVSTDYRFTKSEIPKIKQSNSWNKTAWKGEQVSTQLVLWSSDSITNVSTEFTDFISENGSELPSNIASARFVKYVITDEFGDGCGYRKPENFDASLAADVLDNVDSYVIHKNEARPLWFTIKIPQDAETGVYHGTLNLFIEGQESKSFEFSITVLSKVLPSPSDWKFHLDLWQNPFAVARYNNVELWSDAHWALLKPQMQKLANAGQKVITISLNKRPWGGQTFDQFEAMIDWKKKTDGSWEYNYTKFDNWVQFMMDLEIKNQISCYSMVPWGNEFYYYDEIEEKEIKVKLVPGSKEYENFWVPFLNDFKEHLTAKGWNKITRMAMDERKPEEMQALFELLKEHAPEFGASLADNHESYKLYPDQLMDLSVAFGGVIDAEDLVKRKENGHISTHYVCCADSFPNVFTFSEPAEADFIGWYTIAAGFDGFLRWAYNSWVEHPMQDSRFRTWPAGDTSIVYPENRSSIRFERLLEGIQDAEKIRILREEFKKRNMHEQLEYLNEVVAQFNRTEKPSDLNKMVQNGKNILNRLAKI